MSSNQPLDRQQMPIQCPFAPDSAASIIVNAFNDGHRHLAASHRFAWRLNSIIRVAWVVLEAKGL